MFAFSLRETLRPPWLKIFNLFLGTFAGENFEVFFLILWTLNYLVDQYLKSEYNTNSILS